MGGVAGAACCDDVGNCGGHETTDSCSHSISWWRRAIGCSGSDDRSHGGGHEASDGGGVALGAGVRGAEVEPTWHARMPFGEDADAVAVDLIQLLQ